MLYEGYGVTIGGGREVDNGYVEIEHNTQYCINLHNNRDRRCDVEVNIDGKNVGNFRLNNYDVITIERPVNDQGKFTFYKSGSKEAQSANLGSVSSYDLGLISVTFRPEYQLKPVKTTKSSYRGPDTLCLNSQQISSSNYRSGGTGLSGKSNQSFYEVPDLDYDISQVRTINLRLIAPRIKSEPRELKNSYSTPIPAPL